jgi:DNA processing protein
MNDTFSLFSLLSHPGVSPPIARQLFQQLSHQQKSLLKHLDPTPKHLDLIALKAECPVGEAASLVFELELKGLVRPVAGKQFRLV